MTQYGYEAQLRMYSQSLTGASHWSWPISVTQWRRAARKRLDERAWSYIEGGAGLEETLQANRQAFRRYQIRPHMLNNVASRNLEVTILGTPMSVPFLLAPIGVQSILHPDGELASARAAAESGVPYIASTVSSFSLEQIAAVMGNAIRWFQLYPGKDPDVMQSFLKRAEHSGYSALVVTVDTPMMAWRERDLSLLYLPFLQGKGVANYFTDPAFVSRLGQSPESDPSAAIQQFLSIFVNPAFSWEDLRALRSMTHLPILLKGITHSEDAMRAQEEKLDGIIVSNHGGRQLDGAVSSLDALAEIREEVRSDFLLLMDSGIRSASDICKAMALGASAVLLGRPYAYALAAGGQKAVTELLAQYRATLDLQLALSGYQDIKDLKPDYVFRL